MPERLLSPAVRVASGAISVGVVVVTLLVAFSQVRAGMGGEPKAWAAVGALILVSLGALRLLRAALRGSITVRERGNLRQP